MQSENQQISFGFESVTLFLKREDLIDPFVSGNKFRKLKYNLLEAQTLGCHTLLTFGGAYSNHIAAVAAAGKRHGFKTIGIIRGDELFDEITENPTLKFAQNNGMIFEFISRDDYKNKTESWFIERLQSKFGDFYLLPEGGTNTLAIEGCKEILTKDDSKFDFICCPVGTGGTMAGLVNSALPHQEILGFPALKGDFIKEEIRKFATNDNWRLITEYHFGGYGKINIELVDFINSFYQQTKILLDPIYTGKMIFGVIDMIREGYFPENSSVLAIHTGGIQGISGMNKLLKSRKLPLIETND